MPIRDRLRAILRRVPFGLGVPGTMDHPTAGGLARERGDDSGEADDSRGDDSGEVDDSRGDDDVPER
jgi:hypothetical protein